eukprot:RCo042014
MEPAEDEFNPNAEEANAPLYDMEHDGAPVEEFRTSPARRRALTRRMWLMTGMLLLALVLLAVVYSAVRHAKDIMDRVQPDSSERWWAQTVRKSPNDPRNYRFVRLANGLPVLLSSDPTVDRASAAMDVGVGSDSDPPEVPGLAHFLEHMLFMGSEKFPSEDEYFEFISGHGGGSNAYTDDQHTNFYFTVQPQDLEPALARFSQFFVAPLLSPDAVDREMHAVDNEHRKNLQSDGWRVDQLIRSCAAPGSAFNHFGTGDLTTLNKPDIHKKLLAFYKAHYTTGSRMRLVILGSQPLDTLQGWAERHFSAVPAGSDYREVGGAGHKTSPTAASAPATAAVEDLTTDSTDFAKRRLRWSLTIPPPFGAGRTSRWVTMETVTDTRSMLFLFPVMPLERSYRAQIPQLLCYLVGTKYPHSVYSVLKAQGLATGLSCEAYAQTSDLTLLSISVELTSVGLNNTQKVARSLFEFLNLLRESPRQCHSAWQELLRLEELNFEFQEKQNPDDFTSETARSMHTVAVPDLRGSPESYSYDPQLLKDVLQQMTPRYVLVFVLVKQPDIALPLTEPIYSTHYQSVPLPVDLALEWAIAVPSRGEDGEPTLSFPPLNQFFPSDFSVLALQSNASAPVQLLPDSEVKLWYGRSTSFDVPKAELWCDLDSAVVPRNHTTAALADVFALMVNDVLDESAAQARLVGMSYSFAPTPVGFRLGLSGYSSTLPTLLTTVVATVTGGTEGVARPVEGFCQDRLAALLDQYRRDLQNADMDSPYLNLFRYLRLQLLRTPFFTRAQRRAAVDPTTGSPLTVAQLQAFL